MFGGRTDGASGKPCLDPLPKKGGFDENGENDKFTFYPVKRGFALQTP